MSKRKEVEVVKIKEVYVSWAQLDRKSTEREEDVLLYSDLEEFSKWIKKIKTVPFKGKGKVFFEEKVKFPKRKFIKAFPEAKIVTDPDKADIMIIDHSKLKSEYVYIYHSTLYKCDGENCWTRNKAYTGVDPNHPSQEFYTYGDPVKIAARINKLYKMDGKEIVDITDLSLPSEEVLDEDAYERISKMFTGSDSNMHEMAMRLLTAYDYSRDKAKIAMLVSLGYTAWVHNRNKKMTIEIESLLRKLDLDFPGYQYGSLPFTLKMCAENCEDPVFQKAFGMWVKKQVHGIPDVKLVKA